MGTQKNKQKAIEWLTLVRPMLKEQFTRVDTLTRVTPASFRLYCTGRLHCYATEITLNLQQRQDLFAVILGMFTSNTEQCIIEVPMPEKLENFVFAMYPPKKDKKFREEYTDFALTKPRKSAVTSLMCVSDSTETERLFTSEMVGALNQSAHLINLIYCSDSFEAYETDYKQMAKFVINLPKKKAQIEDFLLAMKCCLKLIDTFAAFSLSSNGKSKAKSLRKKAQSEKMKETRAELDAAAEQRKLDKLQEERDNLKNLTGKELARAEEKIRKREQKELDKKMKARTIVMK
jgi:hypothetical protein